MFKVNNNANASGTHLHGHIKAVYADLEKAFGEPADGDDYKVSGEWTFTNGKDVVTLYDWKKTCLYDPCLQPVADMRADSDPQVFNVGAKNPMAVLEFFEFLRSKIPTVETTTERYGFIKLGGL